MIGQVVAGYAYGRDGRMMSASRAYA